MYVHVCTYRTSDSEDCARGNVETLQVQCMCCLLKLIQCFLDFFLRVLLILVPARIQGTIQGRGQYHSAVHALCWPHVSAVHACGILHTVSSASNEHGCLGRDLCCGVSCHPSCTRLCVSAEISAVTSAATPRALDRPPCRPSQRKCHKPWRSWWFLLWRRIPKLSSLIGGREVCQEPSLPAARTCSVFAPLARVVRELF